jgi:hypothetical protein
VSVASFIASQRADHGVPHVISCRALKMSESWSYKWHDRPPTPGRFQAVSATSLLSFSTGLGYPRVVRGRSF